MRVGAASGPCSDALQRDGADVARCLGALEPSVAVGAFDEHDTGNEVNLAVLQGGPLAGPQPGRGGEQDHRPVARADVPRRAVRSSSQGQTGIARGGPTRRGRRRSRRSGPADGLGGARSASEPFGSRPHRHAQASPAFTRRAAAVRDCHPRRAAHRGTSARRGSTSARSTSCTPWRRCNLMLDAAPRMAACGGGRIVNVCSSTGNARR